MPDCIFLPAFHEGCTTACHTCLKHYWNQRVHDRLDRFAALDLLNWGRYGDLPKPLSIDKQYEIIAPLKRLFDDDHQEIKFQREQEYVSINSPKKSAKFVVYPAMWSLLKNMCNTLYLSDSLINRALPKAFDETVHFIKHILVE